MDSETRSSKRILMDSDEEDDNQNIEQSTESIVKKDGAALGDLFDENDYEDIDEKQDGEDNQEDEDDDAGLFGEDDEEDEAPSKSRSRGSDNDEEEESDENGYYGQQEQEIEIEQREMDLVIPRYPPSHVPDKDTFFVQVPTFLTIDPHAFDPTEFLQTAEEKFQEDGESVEKSHSQRLHNLNTIRWKFGRDSSGNMIKESNARYIKWSDGSLSLQLGNETFDVIEKPNPDVFLAVSHPTQEVLQTTAILKKSMTFVPTSTMSETHKQLREELHKQAQSNNVYVGNWATTDDPEKIKREAVKAEEISLKARRKLEQKKRNLENRHESGSSSRSSRYDSHNDVYGGSARDQYEEDDFVVQDEDEDDDEDENRARRLKDLKRKGAESYKRRNAYDDDDEEEEEVEEEEEEEEAAFTDEEERSRRHSSKKKRRIVGDDSDDE